ncbi:hypothetical protein [Lentisalinibacter sediminis]|uniref:hypothetical protein n=1 Tax=Lentisalinibacter sediminis TaxID=2992237 RepID=UPI00386B78C2
MRAVFLLLIVLSLAVLGAHYLRYGNVFGVAVSLALIGLLFVRSAWAARVIQAALVLGAVEWAHILYELTQIRLAQGAPTARMGAIIGVVILVTVGSALLFQTGTMKRMYGLETTRRPSHSEGNKEQKT